MCKIQGLLLHRAPLSHWILNISGVSTVHLGLVHPKQLCRRKPHRCAFIIRWIEMDRHEKAMHPRWFFNKTTIFWKYAPLFKTLFSTYTDRLKSEKGHGFWTCHCICYIHQQIYSEETFIFIEIDWEVVSTVPRHWKKWTFFKVCVLFNPLNIILLYQGPYGI